MEVKETVERGDRRWWVRLRSAGMLALLLIGLGVAVAGILGVLVLGLAALMDQALG